MNLLTLIWDDVESFTTTPCWYSIINPETVKTEKLAFLQH